MYTRLKIQEAEFFWSNVFTATHGSKDKCFFLSAFLSAIRSTTFVMQSEYKSHPDFERVYPALRKKLADNNVFSQLRDARNVSLKEGHKLPLLVTQYLGKKLGNILTIECDPIPSNENAIRKISVALAERNHLLLREDISEDEKISLIMLNMTEVIHEIVSDPQSVTQSFKLLTSGVEYSLDDLDKHVKSGLADIWRAENELSQAEIYRSVVGG
jgi:hypothetical protein